MPRPFCDGRGWLAPITHLLTAPFLFRVCKIAGGVIILVVCGINMYFVVVYVTSLHSVWLYLLAGLLSLAYLSFVAYLVSDNPKLDMYVHCYLQNSVNNRSLLKTYKSRSGLARSGRKRCSLSVSTVSWSYPDEFLRGIRR